MAGCREDVVEIRRLGEDDVPALIACARRCYGEPYPESDFYEPGHVRSELRARRLLSVGALVGGDHRRDHRPRLAVHGLMSRMGGQVVTDNRDLGIAATHHIVTGEVHLPRQYAELVGDMYAQLGLERRLVARAHTSSVEGPRRSAAPGATVTASSGGRALLGWITREHVSTAD